mgnify:CR=1 FL=1
MLQVESTVHTDEINELPWAAHPERAADAALGGNDGAGMFASLLMGGMALA